MITIKNKTQSQVRWGGKLISANSSEDFSNQEYCYLRDDNVFFGALGSGDAEATYNGFVQNATKAWSIITETYQLDVDGALVTRIKQSDSNALPISRTVQLTTSSTSLTSKLTPITNADDITIALKKVENGALVSASSNDCTVTQLTFDISDYSPMYICHGHMRTTSACSVHVFAAQEIEGTLVYFSGGASFAFRTEWAMELVEPKLCAGNLVVFFQHTAGAAHDIELTLEFYS